jgi:type IV pilus assembly protein PilM
VPVPFQSLFRTLLSEPPPGLACEFTSASVAVARWMPGHPRPERIAVRDLPGDALRPQLLRENLAAASAVADAVASAIEEAQAVNPGKRRREIALLLPDMSARVTVLSFDQFPEKSEEVLPLIRFRLKKTVPFDVEDASIAWRPMERAPGQEPAKKGKTQQRSLLVAVTPRAIVRQYEAIFEQLGYLPGEVTVSTLAGLHLVVDSPDAASGSMLLRSSGSEMTIAVTSRQELRMLRATEYGDEPFDGHADGERFRDIYSSAVFFQDTYGGKVDRIWHAGFGDDAEPLWAQVDSELGVRPRPLVIPGMSEDRHAAYLGIFGMLAEQAGRS